MARYNDDGIPYAVESPFCSSSTNITVHQSKSLVERELGRRFAPLWRALSTKLQEIFPERDAKDILIVPALNARSQVLCILGRRNGVEKPFVRLAPLGHEQLFEVTAPDLCVPSIPDDVLRQIISQASQRMVRPMCDGRSFASSPSRRLASRGPSFRGFPFWWAMQFAISLVRCLT